MKKTVSIDAGRVDRRREYGFSLIELLTVVAIISILVAVLAPSVASISKGSQLNQALIELGGQLEEARQYAIAKNTYVWVAFNDTATATDSQLKMAILASKTGTDLTSWGTDDSTSATANTVLLGKIRTFTQVKLSGAGTFGPAKIPSLPTATDAGNPGTANFTIKGAGAAEQFRKAIEFTPAGEARNSTSMIGVIEIGLQPTRGTVADANNVAVVRVNGLTGQSMIYRP